MGLSYMVVSEAGPRFTQRQSSLRPSFPNLTYPCARPSQSRGLQDPLAELVKIGRRQSGVKGSTSDMPQMAVEALDGVVESRVNLVGVDLNTASAPLLEGFGAVRGGRKNIVSYREQNGAFKSRLN